MRKGMPGVADKILDTSVLAAFVLGEPHDVDENELLAGACMSAVNLAEFRAVLAKNGVADETQIHTHMCYSEFNDIIEAIAHMDADVITIETSRSNMELLDVFDRFAYPNEIGPGVYDIHSPNVPDPDQVVKLMSQAARRIPGERLWVNPDCGLKTRQWAEVSPALKNMVAAARTLRDRAA